MVNYINFVLNFGVCVEFISIIRCVFMGYLYILNEICIKLVNFIFKIFKILVEFKKKEIEI